MLERHNVKTTQLLIVEQMRAEIKESEQAAINILMHSRKDGEKPECSRGLDDLEGLLQLQ